MSATDAIFFSHVIPDNPRAVFRTALSRSGDKLLAISIGYILLYRKIKPTLLAYSRLLDYNSLLDNSSFNVGHSQTSPGRRIVATRLQSHTPFYGTHRMVRRANNHEKLLGTSSSLK